MAKGWYPFFCARCAFFFSHSLISNGEKVRGRDAMRLYLLIAMPVLSTKFVYLRMDILDRYHDILFFGAISFFETGPGPKG